MNETMIVNGFEIAKNQIEFTMGEEYYIANVVGTKLNIKFPWEDDERDKLYISRGIAHRNMENAIAHAKAMLGIDPLGGGTVMKDIIYKEQPKVLGYLQIGYLGNKYTSCYISVQVWSKEQMINISEHDFYWTGVKPKFRIIYDYSSQS